MEKSAEISMSQKNNFVDLVHLSVLNNKQRAIKLIEAVTLAKGYENTEFNGVGFSVLANTVQSILNSKLNENESSYFEIDSKNGRIALFNDGKKTIYSSKVSVNLGGFCVLAVSKGVEYRNGLKGDNGFIAVSLALSEILKNSTYDDFMTAVNPSVTVKLCEFSEEFKAFVESFDSMSSTNYRAFEMMYINDSNKLNDVEKENLLSEMSTIIMTAFKRVNREGKYGGKTNDIKQKLNYILKNKYDSQINQKSAN